MSNRIRLISTVVALSLALTGVSTSVTATGKDKYEDLKWEMLVPKDWDPAKDFKNMDFSKLKDGDPKATEALQSMKASWDAAPAEPSLNGRKVRLPGFVLPIDQSGDAIKTMLLVPYFGACIHTPPPPANQIVQVNLPKPQKDLRTMDAVWVSGTIEVFRSDSPWGAAGYRITADKIEPYKP
jgi:hypothetical protein